MWSKGENWVSLYQECYYHGIFFGPIGAGCKKSQLEATQEGFSREANKVRKATSGNQKRAKSIAETMCGRFQNNQIAWTHWISHIFSISFAPKTSLQRLNYTDVWVAWNLHCCTQLPAHCEPCRQQLPYHHHLSAIQIIIHYCNTMQYL